MPHAASREAVALGVAPLDTGRAIACGLRLVLNHLDSSEYGIISWTEYLGRINTLFPFQQEKKDIHEAVQHRGDRLAY